MKLIKDMETYQAISINGVIFYRVKVFIWKHQIELIDMVGNVIAQIYKRDIRTVEI